MSGTVFHDIEGCPEAARALVRLEPESRRRLEGAARVVRMPEGQPLFRPGDACETYIVVLEGSVKVTLTAESGREILLYRVEPGQSCVLTTAALLAGREYEAEGASETPLKALVIPAGVFGELLDASPVFRAFVFSSFAGRLQDLIGLVGEVAFSRLDRRLALFLLKRAGETGRLAMTHQEIAAEMGSTREAVSRLLKSFERDGLVRLHRGEVEVVDRTGLSRLAEAC